MCAKCTRKPLVSLYLENQTLLFFGNLIDDTFKSIVWRCCKLDIRFLKGREQIWKFVQSCFRWPWIRCYNCASELRLSLRLRIRFNKSLINIFQLVWLFYDDLERSYDCIKLTSIFIKLGVTQVLTCPCQFVVRLLQFSASLFKLIFMYLRVFRCLIVYDVFYFWYVKSSCCHITSNHQTIGINSEPTQLYIIKIYQRGSCMGNKSLLQIMERLYIKHR